MTRQRFKMQRSTAMRRKGVEIAAIDDDGTTMERRFDDIATIDDDHDHDFYFNYV